MTNRVIVATIFLICFSLFSFYSFSQTITADTTLANENYFLGEKYLNTEKFDSAVFYFEKAKTLYIKHLGENCLQNANVLNDLGNVFRNKSMYNMALEYHFKALQIRKEILGEKHPDVVRSYVNIGNVYYNQGEYDKALEYYFKGLQIDIEIFGEKDTDVATGYYSIGNVYHSKGEYDKALEYDFKSLQIRKEIFGEKHPDVAASYNNIGNVYATKGEYNKALEFDFKGLQIKKEILGEKNTDVTASYNNIGNVYASKGEYNKALEYDFKGLQIRKEILGEKHPDVAASYNNIGNVYYIKGEYDKALEYYFKSFQIRKEILGERHPSVANSYYSIGNIYESKGEYDKALEYHFKSLQIDKEVFGERHPSVANIYFSIGNDYYSKGEYDKALEYHLIGLQIDKEIFGEKHPNVAAIYISIGNVYKIKGEYDKSLGYCFKALQIDKEIFGEKHPNVAAIYISIGNVCYSKGEYDKALGYYQKGVASSLLNFNDTVNVINTPILKGYLDWDCLLQSLQAKAEIFADKSKTLTGLTYTERKKIALRHYQACDTLIDITRKEISSQSDKLALSEKSSKVYKETINLLTSIQPANNPEVLKNTTDKDNNLAFYFSEKNKSAVLLEALAGQEAQNYAGIPNNLLQKEQGYKIDIAFYSKQLAEPEKLGNAKTALFQSKLFLLNRSYDSLIMVFEKQFPEYHNLKYNTKTTTVKSIQELLDNKTAMISYVVGGSTVTIFTLTKSNFGVQTVPIIKNLNDSITWFRYGLTKTSSRMQEYYRRIGFLLYQQLFPESATIDKNIENLIIIPDGVLATIPFESLLTSNYTGDIDDYKSYPFLIKKYNISYSYSANLFYRTFSKQKSPSIEITKLNDWLAFAPVFDNSGDQTMVLSTRELQKQLNWLKTDSLMTNRSMFDRNYITPLPATETETEAILKLYDEKNLKAKVLLHDNANEKFIKSGELAKYRMLHFATHGFVNSERPELSGLLLAQDTTGGEDGVLYSGEIYNLKLNADLVVLSACETGLGKIQKGEGIIGLTRALLYAGAKNMIVSLWQVADESTSDLMVDFYKNSLENKGQIAYSEALRNAKLKMISEGRYAHPLYWSPFILIGK